MDIDASAVKDLRQKTGAGIMDCKRALKEAQGNVDKAIEFLRKKGLAKAAKRTGRRDPAASRVVCEGSSRVSGRSPRSHGSGA